jgi:hypothetical protein
VPACVLRALKGGSACLMRLLYNIPGVRLRKFSRRAVLHEQQEIRDPLLQGALPHPNECTERYNKSRPRLSQNQWAGVVQRHASGESRAT